MSSASPGGADAGQQDSGGPDGGPRSQSAEPQGAPRPEELSRPESAPPAQQPIRSPTARPVEGARERQNGQPRGSGRAAARAHSTSSQQTQQKPPVSEADVNALQAVANPKQRRRLPINRAHIDISWVFCERFDEPVPDEQIGTDAQWNLDTLDENYLVRCAADGVDPNPSHPLLTSPRSVLLVIRCGLSCTDLLREPRHRILAQARLEGVPDEVAAIRIQHHEMRRQERLGILRRQYAAARQAVSCGDLAYLVRQASQSEREKAERSISASLNLSSAMGASGDGSPRSSQLGCEDTKELRRKARLLRERALGLPTAPLVYDHVMNLRVGQARGQVQHNNERLVALARRVVDMAASREERFFDKDQAFAREQARREREVASQIVHKRRAAREEGDAHRNRANQILAAAEQKREEERLEMERRQRDLEERLRLREQKEDQHRQTHGLIAERKRIQARQQAEAQAAAARDRAVQRQKAAEERAAEDKELREMRRVARRQEHASQLAEKRERAAVAADVLQERRREYIAKKREAAEERQDEFRRVRVAAAEERRFMGAHRELRSQLVREQRDRLRQKWLDEAAARSAEQARVQQEAARQREAELVKQRELGRLRTEDRRLEKERLEQVQRYATIARLEGQEKKHARLQDNLEQRRAATQQIRQDKEAAVVAHQRALRELREAELFERKRRAFLINNGLWDAAREQPAQQDPAPHDAPGAQGGAPQQPAVVGSGINDPN